MTGSGEDGDDHASRGDAGDGHGHCRRVQPATPLLTFGHGPRDLALPGGHGLLSPQYLLSSVTWLLYAGLIAARAGIGLRGRRATVVTVAGAATALAVLVVYLVRDVRGA